MWCRCRQILSLWDLLCCLQDWCSSASWVKLFARPGRHCLWHSRLIANIPAAYREILAIRLTCKSHFACGCPVKSAVFATRCGCLTCSYCNTSSSRRLPTFPNFKLPHLQLPASHPWPLSTVSAPSSSDTPNVKWQMWNSLQIMLFLWRGVGWKCHYTHGLMELLRWPPAAGVDFHPRGCRSGGSISSLSSDLRAE